MNGEVRIDPTTYTHGGVKVEEIPKRLRIISEYEDSIYQWDFEGMYVPIQFRYAQDGSHFYVPSYRMSINSIDPPYFQHHEERTYNFTLSGEAKGIVVRKIDKIEPED